jgi:hypothetical protein
LVKKQADEIFKFDEKAALISHVNVELFQDKQHAAVKCLAVAKKNLHHYQIFILKLVTLLTTKSYQQTIELLQLASENPATTEDSEAMKLNALYQIGL